MRGILEGRVHFLGIRSDVSQLLNELTLYAHAARQEPLGRVLLEAGASGRAIVATRVGGTDEIFPPAERAAVLLESDSPQTLSDALLNLLADEGTRRRLGVAARRRIADGFDARQAARRLISQYREVAANSPS